MEPSSHPSIHIDSSPTGSMSSLSYTERSENTPNDSPVLDLLDIDQLSSINSRSRSSTSMNIYQAQAEDKFWQDHTNVTPFEKFLSQLELLFDSEAHFRTFDNLLVLYEKYTLLLSYISGLPSNRQDVHIINGKRYPAFLKVDLMSLLNDLKASNYINPNELLKGPFVLIQSKYVLKQGLARMILSSFFIVFSEKNINIPVLLLNRNGILFGHYFSTPLLSIKEDYHECKKVYFYNERETFKIGRFSNYYDLFCQSLRYFEDFNSCDLNNLDLKEIYFALVLSIHLRNWIGIIKPSNIQLKEPKKSATEHESEKTHEDLIFRILKGLDYIPSGPLEETIKSFELDCLFKERSLFTINSLLSPSLAPTFAISVKSKEVNPEISYKWTRVLATLKNFFEHVDDDVEDFYMYKNTNRKAKLRSFSSLNKKPNKLFLPGSLILENEDEGYLKVEFHEILLSLILFNDEARNKEEMAEFFKSFNYSKFNDFNSLENFKIHASSLLIIWLQYFLYFTQFIYDTGNFLELMGNIWIAFVNILRKKYWHSKIVLCHDIDIPDLNHILIQQKLDLLNSCIKRDLKHGFDPAFARNHNMTHLIDELSIANEMDGGTQSPISSMINITIKNIKEQIPNLIENAKKTIQHYQSAESIKEQAQLLPSVDYEPHIKILDHTNSSNYSDAEDEFYDPTEKFSPIVSDIEPEHRHLKFTIERKGHWKPLEGSGDSIYIPYTQDPPILTQDMVDIQMQALQKLSSSETNESETKMRLQSDQLLSDMQAFKAANPGGSFEDFIRWYSPRDWVVMNDDHPSEGVLSDRMKDNNNLWYVLWLNSVPCPAAEQPLLFNHHMEAEKTLHYFEDIDLLDFLTQLLPTVFIVIQEHLQLQAKDMNIALVSDNVNSLANMMRIFPWRELKSENATVLDDLIKLVSVIEYQIGLVDSILRKLPNCTLIAEALLTERQVIISEESHKYEYETIRTLFKCHEEPGRKEDFGTPHAQKIAFRVLSKDKIEDIIYTSYEHTKVENLLKIKLLY